MPSTLRVDTGCSDVGQRRSVAGDGSTSGSSAPTSSTVASHFEDGDIDHARGHRFSARIASSRFDVEGTTVRVPNRRAPSQTYRIIVGGAGTTDWYRRSALTPLPAASAGALL